MERIALKTAIVKWIDSEVYPPLAAPKATRVPRSVIMKNEPQNIEYPTAECRRKE